MSRIGFALSGGLAPPDIVECVQLAEELGYFRIRDGSWTGKVVRLVAKRFLVQQDHDSSRSTKKTLLAIWA